MMKETRDGWQHVEMPDDLLRRLDHGEWLRGFALVLETSPKERGLPMTPFRAGAITRLRYAARYIELLEGANELLTRQIREHRRVDEILEEDTGR
jgi:hypothetical protein